MTRKFSEVSMIATVLSLLVVAATAAASAAPSPAAAPAANGPLRQVTYKVSTAIKNYSAGEHYEGFSSQSTLSNDQGTVTVAITGVQNNALGMDVTELMNKTGHPSTFTGYVTPDGGVGFGNDTITDTTRTLLQFFGTKFIPPDKVDVGAAWSVAYDQNGVEMQSDYKVTKVDGTLVTIAFKQTLKMSAQASTISTEGAITLKPSLLVPMSGDIHKVVRRVSVSGDNKVDITEHFERVSDSRDTSP
jgi:hypothetical protein